MGARDVDTKFDVGLVDRLFRYSSLVVVPYLLLVDGYILMLSDIRLSFFENLVFAIRGDWFQSVICGRHRYNNRRLFRVKTGNAFL